MLFNIYLATPVATLNPTIIVEFAAKPKSDSYAGGVLILAKMA